MAFLEWRRFKFFDLKNSIDSQKLQQYVGDVRITATTSGRGSLILADSDGNVHLVSRNFEISTFRAYDRNISIVEQGRQSPFLVTIGEDEVGINPVIKVWNLEKLDRQGHPTCVRISRAHLPNKAVSTSCLCLHDSLKLMAVGFIDGSVIIYQGDITRERTNKQRILKGASQAVTGLAFQTSGKDTFLYVATTTNVLLYNITHKDREIKDTLDTIGCAPHCCILAESMQDTHFMIARNDAVYCYTTDGRGPCYAVEGEKILLQWYRSYLIIIAKSSALQPAQMNETSSEESDREKHILTVLDMQNKFIVFTAAVREVRAVLAEWGSLYVLTGDHALSLLVEKDLQSKLALLFKKNLYDVAIRIAKSQQYDMEGLVDIFRQYGDHLYGKGDHNAAIEQYIKTIGKLEPSYVIRKFLQSHQIDNLTDYLQALHKQGVATADHTTLLLNCYTKLNKIDKFKEFIMTKDREVDFDVEVAISVCRHTSSEDALLLAEKHALHSWYLKMQIEDHEKYTSAVDYIGKLQFAEAEENMKKFGNILLQHAPKEATDLLKKLCTNYEPGSSLIEQNTVRSKVDDNIKRANPADFIHLFENNSERLVDFLEFIIQTTHKWEPLVYNILVEHYLQVWSRLSDDATRKQWEQRIVRLLESPDARYDRNQTLILCQAVNFRPGVLYLYEENKLYQQILQYHLSQQDYQSVLACCRRFGLQDSSLWVQALWAGAKDVDMPSHLLVEILNVIEKERLLSPLLVVDALSNWNAVKVGDIRSYLQSVLHAEERLTDQDQACIKKYTEETARLRKQISDMQNSAIVFQGSRCSACNQQLELPSVHFLCQHSFHQHCFQSFYENENECPACLPRNKQIMDFIKAQEQGRDLHETFHRDLEKAEDGFTLVANYFGHGVFNKLTIVNDSSPRPPNKNISDLMSPVWRGPADMDKNPVLSPPQRVTAAVKSKPAVEQASIPVKPREPPRSSVGRPSPSQYMPPRVSDSISEALKSPSVSNLKAPVSLNPFEEDDYPAHYNPFENDDEDEKNVNHFPS